MPSPAPPTSPPLPTHTLFTDYGRLQVMTKAVKSVCVGNGGLVGGAGEGMLALGYIGSRAGQAKLQVERLVMCPDNTTVLTVDNDGHMHLIDLIGTNESLTSSLSSLSFESEK
uniref:Uncharacterized protein n=1 Tax=Graphocephala atropunctata TaxID=36148 RepID=A0A1B6KJ03_9HEMI